MDREKKLNIRSSKKTSKKDKSRFVTKVTKSSVFENLKLIADTIALHNGKDCEVCIHDLTTKNISHSIIYIVNNHVTGRKVGDSFSFNYLKSRKILEDGKELKTVPVFSNQTYDGKYLKCSTIYIKDENDKYHYMLCINQDVSAFIQAGNAINEFITSFEDKKDNPQNTLPHVNDILDDLITQSIKYIGKTPANMTTQDKKQAIQFLNDQGAFLISKSGDRVSEYFGLSKFSIYSYIKDGNVEVNANEENDDNVKENVDSQNNVNKNAS